MDDLIAQLRRKGRIVVDEHIIEYAGEWHRLREGDQYLAQNGDNPPELLTCRRLEPRRRASGRTTGKVFPKERKKRLYNLEEVIKVIIRANPNYDPSKKEEPDGPVIEQRAELHIDSAPTGSERSDGAGPAEGAAADIMGDLRPVGRGIPRPPVPSAPRDPRQRSGRTDYTAIAKPQ